MKQLAFPLLRTLTLIMLINGCGCMYPANRTCLSARSCLPAGRDGRRKEGTQFEDEEYVDWRMTRCIEKCSRRKPAIGLLLPDGSSRSWHCLHQRHQVGQLELP